MIPYWLAWWTRFSFDARFLLLILPLMAMWAARPLAWIVNWLAGHLHPPRFVWQIGGSLLLLGLLVWGAKDRLGGIYYTLTQPFASDQSKLERTKGAMFYLVEYARLHLNPATDHLYLMDERLAYYLSDFDYTVGFPQKLAVLEGYDYLFHVSSMYSIYGDRRLGWQNSEFYMHAFDPLIFEPVYEYDGVHVMRILRTDLPSQQEYDAYNASHP